MKNAFLSMLCMLSLHQSVQVTAQVSNDYLTGNGVVQIIPQIAEDELSVSWSAEKEVNIRWYILERSVNDGEFTMLAMVPARNHYSFRSTYQVNDHEIVLQPGMEVHYQLKTVDMNGARHTSTLIVKKETDGLITSR